MRFPPTSVVASWPLPNYVDPPTHKPYLIPLLVLLTFAATSMVLLRLYTRFCHSRAGSDDWLVVVAIIPGIAYTIVISIAVTHFGWDRHVWDIPPGPEDINSVRERAISWASQMLYVWTASLTKISLLCFYRRAFTTPTMQKVVAWVLTFTVLFAIVCVILLCIECQPLNFYWEEFRIPSTTQGHCGNEGAGLTATGIINVLFDITILVLPVRTVLNLNILWSQKAQVLSIFAAGILVVACSTARVYEVWETTEVTYDVTWKGYNAYLFTGVEMFVGLICACLPACRSLLKQWRESTRQSNQNLDSNGKHDFSTTMDSTQVSMPPPNVINKRTKTTIDVEYMRMDHLSSHKNENGSQLSLGITSPGEGKIGPGINIWGAEGSATNVTKAWAGRSTREKRGRPTLNSNSNLKAEKVEIERLGLCNDSVTSDKEGNHRVTFEDERSTLKGEELGGGSD